MIYDGMCIIMNLVSISFIVLYICKFSLQNIDLIAIIVWLSFTRWRCRVDRHKPLFSQPNFRWLDWSFLSCKFQVWSLAASSTLAVLLFFCFFCSQFLALFLFLLTRPSWIVSLLLLLYYHVVTLLLWSKAEAILLL